MIRVPGHLSHAWQNSHARNRLRHVTDHVCEQIIINALVRASPRAAAQGRRAWSARLHIVPHRCKALALRLEDGDAGRLEAAAGHADAGVADPGLALRARAHRALQGRRTRDASHTLAAAMLAGANGHGALGGLVASRAQVFCACRAQALANAGARVPNRDKTAAPGCQPASMPRAAGCASLPTRLSRVAARRAHREVVLVAVRAEPGAGGHGGAHVLEPLPIAHAQARAAEAARRAAAAAALELACTAAPRLRFAGSWRRPGA